jgi:hypothetical protein
VAFFPATLTPLGGQHFSQLIVCADYQSNKRSYRRLETINRMEGIALGEKLSGNEQLFNVGSLLGAVEVGGCCDSP